MDLKLPEIVPARVVPSAADAIDRAGASFKRAADDVAEPLLKEEMAQVATQTQEATLQSTRGMNDTLHLIKSTPYLEPQQVKDLFGGVVPEGISLTEPVVGIDQQVTQQERAVIPMHEVSTELLSRRSKVIVDNAASNIKAPGWQTKFREAAAVDVERARAEALNWQRGQRMADAEIRSVAQFQHAVNSRAWDTAEAILGNANFTMSVEMREKLREQFPMMRTMAEISDRLQSNSVADIDALITDISANRVRASDADAKVSDADLAQLPEGAGAGDKLLDDPVAAAERKVGKFRAPLSVEQQNQLLNRARDRKNEILNEEARAAKAAKEARFQDFVDKIQVAQADAVNRGGEIGQRISVANIPLTFDADEYKTARDMILADPGRVTPPEVTLGIGQIMQEPGLLGRQTAKWVADLNPRMAQKDWEQLVKDWTKSKADPDSVKAPVPDYVMAHIKHAVDVEMGGSDKAREDSVTALRLQARAYEIVAQRLKADPSLAGRPTEIIAMVGSIRNGAKVGRFGASAVPGEAHDIIIAARPGLADTAIRAEYQKAQKIESTVKEVWGYVMGDDDDLSPKYDAGKLMDTFYRVTTPANRAELIEQAKARIAKKPGGAKLPLTEREIIYQAVLNQAPPETDAAREQRNDEAQRKIANRQMEEREEKVQQRVKEFSLRPPPELKKKLDTIKAKYPGAKRTNPLGQESDMGITSWPWDAEVSAAIDKFAREEK
jgi:hypothetical protein